VAAGTVVIRSLLALWERLPRWLVAVADQGLVAILNLSLSVTVTQIAGVTTLGRFAIIATTTTLCMGVARLLVTDPWLASRTAHPEPVAELRWLVGIAAVGAAMVTAAVVVISAGGDGRWFIAVPIAAAVVLQDFARYVSFRVERTTGAFLSDVCVFAAAAACFGIAALLGRAGLTALLLSWLVGLVLGVLVVSDRMVGTVSSRGALAWWRTFCRNLSTRLALDTAAYMLGVSGSLYLLAYVGTQRDVGLVRIVQTMFSPAALVVTGLTMWLVPFLANRSPGQAERVRARATVWLVAGSLPLITLAVALGPWFAGVAFGLDGRLSYVALGLAGLSTAAMALAAPWIAAARVSGHYLPIAWARAAAAIATLAGMLTVTTLRSASGYLGLLAFQNIVVAVAAITIGVDRSPRRGKADL
jgi:hypothetical protein